MDESANNVMKQEMDENKINSDISKSELSQAHSNVLSSSRLKCLEQNTKNDKIPHRSFTVLRPSQLNGNINSNPSPQKTFLLNPSRLNPFAKVPQEDGSDHNESKEISTPSTACSNSTPKFLPLLQNGGRSETVTPAASASARSSDFVFGQNIQDRVISDSKPEENGKPISCVNTNGTSDMLFSTALKENTRVEDAGAGCSTNVNGTSNMLFSSALKDTCASPAKPHCTKSLSESAREYEESRAVKRKYEEVEVKTGEEGETNVLQIMCKLFAFDKVAGGSWQERGRGTLRLNDQETDVSSHSRLVFRTAGSLRVVLNTKIWAEMTVQRASEKSIRLTAFDSNGEIKVFLLTGNPEDVKQLQKHLEIRVRKEQEKHKSLSATDVASSPEPNSKKLADGAKDSS